jgi:hypothetical protein
VLRILEQLGVTWKDVFLAGVAVGVLWAGRNRRATGERIGAVEDAVSEVRGLLKAIGGGNGNGK